ncbi:hypothetical protein MMC24_003886 [Lignoscripta atroalba]|nr:hypothetical protein [Lignoscripta atroalba]
MVKASPTGHDFGPTVNLDGVGIAYIVFIVIYSLVLFTMLVAVYRNRLLPAIRMRDVPLMIMGVLLLHVYLVIICNVYVWNGTFPCGLEYWVMSLWFPLGIGCFQLQNAQLLIRSIEQNDLLYSSVLYKKIGQGPNRFLERAKYSWTNLNRQQRYTFYVSAGMVVQVIVSLGIYLASRKFHSFGSVSEYVGPAACRRGFEWVPTIAWQFIWTYFFGPYLLWKIRTIRDIYGWRRQTTIAVIAGLPGSPLWLAAVYSDGFFSVSKYWPAPMWFAPGIITMQIVTLAGPLNLVWKHMQYERLKSSSWDKSSGTDKFSTVRSASSTSTAISSRNNMQALEQALDTNPSPLQRFAATREFAGENIHFLVTVRKWKANYNRTMHRHGEIPPSLRRQYFNEGVEIYVSYIDPRFSEFTVNLESHIYKSLARIFGVAVQVLQRRPSSIKSSATPWENEAAEINASGEVLSPGNDGHESGNESTGNELLGKPIALSSIHRLNSSKTGSQEHIIPVSVTTTEAGNGDPLALHCDVPESFDGKVFDAAESSVRYMVLNNSWRNYNNALEKGSIRTDEFEVPSSP